MALFDRLLEYLKKGYGFKPGPKVMAWLVFIVLTSIAGSYILDMYHTTLDIRLKQRELNKTDEPQKQTSKRIASQAKLSLSIPQITMTCMH